MGIIFRSHYIAICTISHFCILSVCSKTPITLMLIIAVNCLTVVVLHQFSSFLQQHSTMKGNEHMHSKN